MFSKGNSYMEIKRQLRKGAYDCFQKLYRRHKDNFEGVPKPQVKNVSFLMQGILRAKTPRLVGIAGNLIKEGCLKTILNRISYLFSGGKRKKRKAKKSLLDAMRAFSFRISEEELGEIKEKIVRYKRKTLTVMDWTAYKKKARKNKEGKGMQYPGKIYDARVKKVVTGYGGLWGGCVVKDDNFFFTSHKLYSNTWMDKFPEECKSLNDLEQSMIQEIIRTFGKKIILLCDMHFSSKNGLLYTAKEGIDFLMRIDSDIHVEDTLGWQNILKRAEQEKEKHIIYWYQNKGKKKIPCEAVFFKANLFQNKDKKRELFVSFIVMKPIAAKLASDTFILVTTLSVNKKNLQGIVSLYKHRWSIETGIKYLKQQFELERFMVRKWHGIELMIEMIMLVFQIFLICFLACKEFTWLIELTKKVTVIKNKRVTFGKFCELVRKISPKPRLPSSFWDTLLVSEKG